MILNHDKAKIFLDKSNINSKEFHNSSKEYVFQETGQKNKYIVEDNFKVLKYDIPDKKNGIRIKGKIEFFEPNIFILTKDSEYFNKQVSNQKAFGECIVNLRSKVSKNQWSINMGDYSKSSVNICFYAPSGINSFITGISGKYYKGHFLGIDDKPLKSKLKTSNINNDIIVPKNKKNSLEIGVFDKEKMLEKVLEIEKSSFLTSTEKEIIIKARIGQATFRKDLVDEFKGRCILSGINVPELLIASHIKPWNVSKNEERIDKDNGLLLSSSIDKLFDKHLISFDDNGFMLISKKFRNDYHNYQEIMKKIGIYEEFINGKKSINFHENRKKYLKIHAEKTRNLHLKESLVIKIDLDKNQE